MKRTIDPFVAEARHDVADGRFVRVRCACGEFWRKVHAMSIPCTRCREYVDKVST